MKISNRETEGPSFNTHLVCRKRQHLDAWCQNTDLVFIIANIAKPSLKKKPFVTAEACDLNDDRRELS